MPIATLVPRSRKNVRITRGENCWDASCKATMVTDSTSVLIDRIAAAIVDSRSCALVAPPVNE